MKHSVCKDAALLWTGHVAKAVLCVVLLGSLLSLSGCVTREIKEDPWNSPRGSVDMRKYDTAPGAEVTPGSRSYD